ncbi:hypothetical protein BDZ89DRAFT_1068799, partial [Hymenopellis radicata]
MPATLSASTISAAHVLRPYHHRPSHDILLTRSLHDSPAMHSWQNIHHTFTGNPYPVVQPPAAHKVWILDCRSCGTFITNRGMKAVLLLRPNVALYSSDALPINCSAYTTNPDALRPPACRPSSSASTQRTCECLTQTLCCHACGATVGYMIVIPCARCTSSISTANRATNGHRFVFILVKLSGPKRHYVLDEPGVIPFDESSQSLDGYDSHSRRGHSRYESPSAFHPDSYLPTSPLDASTSPANESFLFSEYPSSHESSSFSYAPQPLSHSTRHPSFSHSFSRPSSTGSEDSDDSIPPPLESPPYPYGLPADHTLTPPPQRLKPGDILYWHHLSRHGEIPGVQDDARARQRTNPAAKKLVY